MRYRYPLIAILLLVSLEVSDGASISARRVPFWVCSDGKGTVSLFWLPPDGQWPAGGFRLERISGRKTVVIARNLLPGGDAEAMALLDPGDSAAIRRLADRIGDGSLTDDERNTSITVMGRNAIEDMIYGRALGVRYTDRTKNPGRRKYRLTGLSPDGNPDMVLESNDVDPAKPTPGPRRPATLQAEARRDGVALFWQDPAADGIAPVVAYHVVRTGPGRKIRPLTQTPLALKKHLSEGLPDFVDTEPPLGAVTYRVQSVDIFGRRSANIQTRVLVMNSPAPAPPADRTAVAAKPEARVLAVPDNTAARLVEPPPAPGPAATAAKTETRKAPEPAAKPEETSPPRRPVARMEIIVHPSPKENPGGPGEGRGEPAPPADRTAVAAKPEESSLPGRPVARMEKILLPPPVENAGGSGDEGKGPPRPIIVGISGMKGKVTIEFKPGRPEKGATQVIVLRSESAMSPGHVVGRPIPSDARLWEDASVTPGQNIWYRLVAVDKDGNQSLPTNPRWIRVAPR